MIITNLQKTIEQSRCQESVKDLIRLLRILCQTESLASHFSACSREVASWTRHWRGWFDARVRLENKINEKSEYFTSFRLWAYYTFEKIAVNKNVPCSSSNLMPSTLTSTAFDPMVLRYLSFQMLNDCCVGRILLRIKICADVDSAPYRRCNFFEPENVFEFDIRCKLYMSIKRIRYNERMWDQR